MKCARGTLVRRGFYAHGGTSCTRAKGGAEIQWRIRYKDSIFVILIWSSPIEGTQNIYFLIKKYGGGEIRAENGSIVGEKRFLRFTKIGQFTDMRNSDGKTPKTPNFVHLKMSHKIFSVVLNQSRMGLALQRTRFDYYFENFGGKVWNGRFKLLPKIFKIMVKTCSLKC